MISDAKWGRPSVRMKTYDAEWLNQNEAKINSDPATRKDYANYSQPCVLSKLNRTNQKRLDFLLSSACEADVYYPDIGFKTAYTGRSKRFCGDDWVYVVATSTVAKAEHPDREQVRLRRYKREELSDFKDWDYNTHTYIDVPIERQAQYMSMRWFAREVFMDRLKQHEKDKLAMLMIAPEQVYVPGFGIKRSYYGEMTYFLEE